jgi:hypothetical protein
LIAEGVELGLEAEKLSLLLLVCFLLLIRKITGLKLHKFPGSLYIWSREQVLIVLGELDDVFSVGSAKFAG